MADYNGYKVVIEGMHCDACVRRVTQALGALPGVRVHTVDVGRAHVLAEPHCEPLIREAIAKAGFQLQSIDGEG